MTEVAKTGGGFEILARPAEELREIIQANVGGNGKVTAFDLDRVKVPAGGGLQWQIPTIDGEESRAAVEGIVIHWKDTRAYWPEKFGQGEGTSPPQCSSDDGVTGVGDPGGICDRCPHAQFGSDPAGGKGQACKQIRLLFLVRPESLMPIVLPAPPTSVQAVKKYFLRLAGYSIPFWGVVSSFALERATNAGGIKYARIQPKVGRRLSAEESAQVKSYAEAIRGALDRVQVNEEDYSKSED